MIDSYMLNRSGGVIPRRLSSIKEFPPHVTYTP